MNKISKQTASKLLSIHMLNGDSNIMSKPERRFPWGIIIAALILTLIILVEWADRGH